ncbi:MAG: hypothetical protein JST63_13195 [Bacteroidetes bacterium]|nr:hypothetical protein [Bacteroidota bacterium]
MNIKKHTRYFSLFFGMLLTIHFSYAQDSTQKKFQISGYVTDMQIVAFKNADSMLATNLIHNRLNLQWTPNEQISFHGGIRNRIFFGNPMIGLPGFGNQIGMYNDRNLLDLSKSWVNKPSLIINTTIDRLYADWAKGRWDISIGRQRINWGKTLVWNPNDWFNTFNYADFDYIERPGSDAARIQYFPTGMSVIDVAVSPGRYKNQTVAAVRYGFNKWNYDFQILGGLYRDDIALGLGWGGNIGSVGFRGEGSWFQPKENLFDASGSVGATISFDYRSSNTWYVQGAVLYNSIKDKVTDPDVLIYEFMSNLSAKRMMPTSWSFFTEASRDITPLWHVDFSAMTGIQPVLLFLMPNMSYSLTENFDISAYAQIFIGSKNGETQNLGNGIYMRFKYSF